jgi:hypothetical protein
MASASIPDRKANEPTTTAPSMKPDSTASGARASYPSCISSDPNHLCLGLKIVSYLDSSGVPVLTESDAITLVNGMNANWSQCNIGFQLEVFEVVNPTDKGLNYSPDWQTETYTIRGIFADPSRFLIAAVGPWTVSTIAVTTMPGSGVYGTVVDKQFARNPLTVGHELGHYQGLYHVDDTSNLMSAFIGSDTKVLTADQCSISRKTDLANWSAMLRRP